MDGGGAIKEAESEKGRGQSTGGNPSRIGYTCSSQYSRYEDSQQRVHLGNRGSDCCTPEEGTDFIWSKMSKMLIIH